MEIKIDEKKILSEILERDDSLHLTIKRKVEENLIKKLVREIEDKYISKAWGGREEISRAVINDLEEKQTELVIKILKEFYSSYKYKKDGAVILKKLNEFINKHE